MLCKVLYAEDDPFLAELILTRLKPVDGIHISWVKSLAALLSELRISTTPPDGEAYDCLILDLGLGDSEGVETYRRICQFYATPTIVLTGDKSPETAKTLLALGVKQILYKNEFTPDSLAMACVQVIASHIPSFPEKLKDGLTKTKLTIKTSSVFAGGYIMALGQVLAIALVGADIYSQYMQTHGFTTEGLHLTEWEMLIITTYFGALGIGKATKGKDDVKK